MAQAKRKTVVPKTRLEPGAVVTIKSWEAKAPHKMRTSLQSYLNKRFRGHYDRFSQDSRPDQEVTESIFEFLMDVGEPFGLTFDLLNKETVEADDEARYGWQALS